jgi:acetyl-CoA acetyltransferase
LIRAIEAVGIATKGTGGAYIEEKYHAVMDNIANGRAPQDVFPINTHGGLLAFGAPWEVPAMFNIIESFNQLTNVAGKRQVGGASRALGVLS